MSSIIVPQGDGLISYIDALDIGEAAARCLLHPEAHHQKTYVLTGGRAYGAKGVAAEIGRVLGKPVTYINIEEEQARDMMPQMGTPPWLVEAGLAVFAHAKAGGEAAVDPSSNPDPWKAGDELVGIRRAQSRRVGVKGVRPLFEKLNSVSASASASASASVSASASASASVSVSASDSVSVSASASASASDSVSGLVM